MCLPNIMNLLCISHCCPQYFCDVYPLHHSHFVCLLLYFHLVFLSMCCPVAILGLLEFSLFCCAAPLHCTGSVKNFNFRWGYREIILFVSISCAVFCVQQHCLDIAYVKLPLAPFVLSFGSQFPSAFCQNSVPCFQLYFLFWQLHDVMLLPFP